MVKKAMYRRIQQLKLQGRTKRAIADELGIDRKTVRRYWRMSEEEYRKYRREFLCREKEFEVYRAGVLEIYRENDFERLPMSSVYDYLEELHGDLPGTEKTLRNYIHHLRCSYGSEKCQSMQEVVSR